MILFEEGAIQDKLILNRPEKKNALNKETCEQILFTLERAKDTKAASLLLQGAGNTFCSGADLKEDLSIIFPLMLEVFKALYYFPKPIVAYVEGYCLAGGMGLIATADIVCSHPDAIYGLPEVKKNIVPKMVTQLLGKIIDSKYMLELALTGEFISAERAYHIGLINRIGDPIILEPSPALAEIKKYYRDSSPKFNLTL